MSKRKGFLSIELLFVMVILILFGLTTFTLAMSGSKTYSKLTDKKENNSQLRVAISYVNMKIIQNNTSGSFDIRKNPFKIGNALVINQKIGSDAYEDWIYCSNGRLREAIVKKGEAIDDSLSLEVANIAKITFGFKNGNRGISIAAEKPYENKNVTYKTTIAIIN